MPPRPCRPHPFARQSYGCCIVKVQGCYKGGGCHISIFTMPKTERLWAEGAIINTMPKIVITTMPKIEQHFSTCYRIGKFSSKSSRPDLRKDQAKPTYTMRECSNFVPPAFDRIQSGIQTTVEAIFWPLLPGKKTKPVKCSPLRWEAVLGTEVLICFRHPTLDARKVFNHRLSKMRTHTTVDFIFDLF